ncbi:MAG: hypothetical protein JWO04_3836 [Gammaproteobacteria bacterium]|jgi:hypothetical protein|nr:hypothetical protein [Gammaproteobacteria bacterium]
MISSAKYLVAAVALALAATTATAQAVTPAPCDIRLIVELTPDIPDPRDAGFLNSLLSNEVAYQLILRRERSDTIIVAELTGPGPDYLCREAIERIRKDGHVLSVRVTPW